MSSNILMVRNMVCHRCVLAVEDILKKQEQPFEKVEVGEIYMKELPDDASLEALKKGLSGIGLELIDNRTTGLIEKIKTLLIKKARNEAGEAAALLKLSNYLTSHLHLEYTYLSSLFSSVEGRTIEHFFIEQRIEKVKELLVYGEKNLSEIAFDLEYSSVAHLSNQFKKVTGLTPSHFRKIGTERRKMLDKV